jgi:outer membrane immunogenic protein
MKMRSVALTNIVLLGAVATAMGQATPTPPVASGDVVLTYHWVRTNAQPGDCGCFDLNGGGASGSWNFNPQWAAVAEISGEYAGSVPSTGNSLTLISYMAGTRYRVPQPWLRGQHGPQLFAQLLLGAAHAGGGIAGAGDGAVAFATRMGGGIDLPMRSHFAVRIIQADYDLTRFKNSINDHQNNLLLGAGVVFHWSRNK